jgi:hypothetical protein
MGRGVRDRVVRIPTGTLDSFMWGSYPASLRNVGGSTQVPVCAWNNPRKDTWDIPPPVKLERRDMTYTVSMWRKTQNKQTNKHMGKCTLNLNWNVIMFKLQTLFVDEIYTNVKRVQESFKEDICSRAINEHVKKSNWYD